MCLGMYLFYHNMVPGTLVPGTRYWYYWYPACTIRKKISSLSPHKSCHIIIVRYIIL
jgi:hypothetical protein